MAKTTENNMTALHQCKMEYCNYTDQTSTKQCQRKCQHKVLQRSMQLHSNHNTSQSECRQAHEYIKLQVMQHQSKSDMVKHWLKYNYKAWNHSETSQWTPLTSEYNIKLQTTSYNLKCANQWKYTMHQKHASVKVQVQVYIREVQNDQTATVNGAKHKSATANAMTMYRYEMVRVSTSKSRGCRSQSQRPQPSNKYIQLWTSQGRSCSNQEAVVNNVMITK